MVTLGVRVEMGLRQKPNNEKKTTTALKQHTRRAPQRLATALEQYSL